MENTTISEQTHYSEAQNRNESQELGVWKNEEERSLFGKEFYAMAQNCSAIKNPRAYTATVIQRIDRGETESIDTLQLWRDGATEQELFFQFVETPHPQRKQSNQSNSSKSSSKVTPRQSNVLSEWQIKPENTDLIEQGCEVGEPYPQFLKWAVERCQRSGETRQQTKLRLLTQFDFNSTAPKELWRDYKQFLDNQYQELQNNESKGLPYYAPEELKLTPEVPEERAKEASVAINRKLLGEYQLVQNMRELVEAESTPQPCLVKESSVSGIYHQAEIPNLWESSDVHSSSTVEVLSDSEISDQLDDDEEVAEENVVLPDVPEWLSPSAIAASVQKHQTANRKGFKPYLTLINASLKRGDDAHKRAILDIVETLSEQDQRQIKIPVISEPEQPQSDKPELVSQQQDKVDPSWLEMIAQMIQQMACTPYEEFIIDAINQALGEVCEEMQSQILKLARDALSLNALNQIEVAF